MFKPIALAALAAVGLIAGAPAAAESTTRVGDFTIYHNAVTADTLAPEVANALGIQRSKARGVLNVSVIKEQPGILGSPVRALVDLDTVDAADQKTRIPMREIETRGAVSYLGEFPVANGQEVRFELRVRPAGAAESTVIRMSQEFFTE